MSNWVRKKISEVGQVVSGATPSTSRSDFWSGDIIWITPADLSKNKTPFIQESERKISEAGLQSCSAFVVPSGNLVLSSRAPIGYFAIVNANFTTNQGCKSVLFNKEQNPLFHYYNFLFRVKEFKEKGEGTTFAEISKSEIAKLEFPIPDNYHEQTTIASILITIDQSIEKTEQLIAKYERIKTGLMQDLITRGIDEQGNIRSQETHVFKDSVLGRVPKEWEVGTLDSFLELTQYGLSVSSSENGVPFLRMNNIKDGELFLKDMKYCSFHVPDSLILNDLDLLFNRTNSIEHVGRTGVFRTQNEKFTFASYLVRLVPKKNLHSEYLNYWMNLAKNQNFIKTIATQAIHQANINPTNLGKILLAIPKLNEQIKIIEVIKKSNESILSLKFELSKLNSQKTGLMQDLLTRKVRVDGLISSNLSILKAL